MTTIVNGYEIKFGAALREAALREADLRRADLREADLREADLCWADLRWADLREADLREADLCWAALRGADLRWADLRGADLSGADLSGARLRRANLSGTSLPDPPEVLSASWYGEGLPDDLVADLMTYDAACHPDPEAFTRWAAGGPCPYKGVRVARACWFREQKALWAPQRPLCRPHDLMTRLFAACGVTR